MSHKRFFTDYPRPGTSYDGAWRQVEPTYYDNDKYVTMRNGEDFKLGYLRHGRPHGPIVSPNYATRFFTDNVRQNDD